MPGCGSHAPVNSHTPALHCVCPCLPNQAPPSAPADQLEPTSAHSLARVDQQGVCKRVRRIDHGPPHTHLHRLTSRGRASAWESLIMSCAPERDASAGTRRLKVEDSRDVGSLHSTFSQGWGMLQGRKEGKDPGGPGNSM